jgi:hypothetical protein
LVVRANRLGNWLPTSSNSRVVIKRQNTRILKSEKNLRLNFSYSYYYYYRSKLPSVKIVVGQNGRMSKWPYVKMAVGQKTWNPNESSDVNI